MVKKRKGPRESGKTSKRETDDDSGDRGEGGRQYRTRTSRVNGRLVVVHFVEERAGGRRGGWQCGLCIGTCT